MSESNSIGLVGSDLNAAWDRAYQEKDGQSLWQDDPIPQLSEAIEETLNAGKRTVLDIGCGDGRNLMPLVSAGLTVTGADVSATAIARAADRLEAAGQAAFVITSDATNLPFGSESLDVVTCFDVFSHFVDPEASLAELNRVLRPGGLLFANVFSTEDSECGVGEQVSGTTYLYRDTMFRFYEDTELRGLLEQWDISELRTDTWIDPPHGEFRPYEHSHSSLILKAAKPR